MCSLVFPSLYLRVNTNARPFTGKCSSYSSSFLCANLLWYWESRIEAFASPRAWMIAWRRGKGSFGSSGSVRDVLLVRDLYRVRAAGKGERQRHVLTCPSAGSLFRWLFAWLGPSSRRGSDQMSSPQGSFSWLSYLNRSPSLIILHSSLPPTPQSSPTLKPNSLDSITKAPLPGDLRSCPANRQH